MLIVTDKSIRGLPFFASLLDRLGARFSVGVFDDVAPEPPVEAALRAAEAAREADVIVAIGGGSVIDVAKAASVLAKRPGVSVEDIAPFNPLRVEYEKPYLVAVPTTAGTGSDASYGIVLSKKEPGVGKVKVAVGSYEVIPHATVLDPALPRGAPDKVRIGAVADALSHAVEALASTNSNPVSEALAEKAAALILTEAPRALRGGSEEAWLSLHAAATMAGMAFSNSGLGLAHAIAHPLGGLLGTHHGTTVGIVLPAVVRLYEAEQQAAERLARLKAMLERVYGLPGRPSLADHIEALYLEIGQPRRFSELHIEKPRFEEAARHAASLAYHDPDIAFSPVVPSEEEIVELLLSLY